MPPGTRETRQPLPSLALLRQCLATKPAQDRAHNLFYAALDYLDAHSGAEDAALDQPSAEDAWAPCIAWLLKSIPGLVIGPGEQQQGHQEQEAIGSMPLSELLDTCSISLVSFFKELPVVLNKLRPWISEAMPDGGADTVDSVLRLREWQETLTSLTHLASKYKDLFWHIQRSNTNSSSSAHQALLRAGWLAFLNIKAQLLPGFPDLVSCLELLVCALNLVLSSSDIREQQLQQLQQQYPGAISADGRFCTLRALSHEAKVDFAKTQALMPQIEGHFRTHLEQASFSWLPQPLPAELPHPLVDRLDTCCSLHLQGLASSPQQLNELVLSLDAAYQTWYSQQGEIDEREFLLTDFGGLASPRTLPGAAIHMPGSAVAGSADARSAAAAAAVKAEAANGDAHASTAAAAAGGSGGPTTMSNEHPQQHVLSPLAALAAGMSSTQQHQQQQRQKPPLVPGSMQSRRAGDFVLQGLQSPLPMMGLGPPGPQTPISQAMGSVSWLRSLAQGLTAEPSAALQRYMQAAGADAGPVLVERMQAAAEAVFMSDAAGDPVLTGGLQGLQHGLAQERQTQGIKLYWHVLEAMLRAEEARAGLSAAGALLTRWPFHQCLLACSFEVVAASYRMGLLSFPAIPAKLGLKPFDLSKMIGPFVKAEPSLPRELKRHMFTVEEKILESLGWAPGSSFFKLMRAATGQQQQQPRGATARQQQGEQDTQMQDADGAHPVLPTAEEEQHELQQEAAAAAAVDAASATAAAAAAVAAAAAAATDLRRRSFQGTKRGSETGSAGDAMDTEGSRGSASPSGLSGAAKRHRGHGSRATDSPRHSTASGAAPGEDELPLPRALGLPPGSSNAAAASAAGGSSDAVVAAAAAAGDSAARAVLHDYCRKVLKLAAFRLVAVSEGLDFSPMTREEVVAHVHELLAATLYQHTYLFYSRHLDTLLLACLYGFCKVNKLQQITFREILGHYKRQAHAKQEVFRTVVLQQTDPHLVTQSSGDIIAFYNAVFVPAMKGVLLAVSHPSNPAAAAAAAAASTPQQPTSAAAAAAATGVAADSSSRPSPMQTAMQLTAATQPPQQRGRSGSTAGSPGSGGSAYRALTLPGAAVSPPGGGTSLAGLPGGSSLLAGMGAGGPLSMPQTGAGSHETQAFGGGGSSGSSSFWTAEDDPAGATAADAAAAAAAAAAMAAGSSVPSRLSRLSRPGGGPDSGPVGTALGAEVVQLPGGGVAHPKAAAAGVQPTQQLGRAAADAYQQQDQGRQPRPGSAGFRSSSEPQSPATGGAWCDLPDSSVKYQPGSSSSSPMAGSGMGSVQQQQQGSQGHAVTAGRSPGIAAAAAAVGSPSAGLATLMQALDTKSTGSGPAAAACQGGPGHLSSSCGQQQQQAAVMMDL